MCQHKMSETVGSDFGCKRKALDVENGETSDAIVIECAICKLTAAKYRCPRCERATCGLNCCRQHKKKFECDGKRDRTKFINLKSFGDSDLTSDYFFLEEIGRSSRNARMNPAFELNSTRNSKRRKAKLGLFKRSRPSDSMVNPHVGPNWLEKFPVATQLLVKQAQERDVSLIILAAGMTKHKQNTSYFNTRSATLYWRIEWNFALSKIGPMTIVDERVEESKTLIDLLRPRFTKTLDNAKLSAQLRPYISSNWETDVVVLLCKEFTPGTPQYHRLALYRTLAENLSQKMIVEFPVCIVTLLSEIDRYQIVHDLVEEI
uniref:Uncharacterized protein AlNc14C297G10326 n=1 Tax=Albugo laibachii Nc14 TaxID=890382 RepID=F0WVJ1_9STRA|nr:conserved hypothetical protein [Albugo laibachii Nc14]|eukprot:CCA25433.1 conserved hypothetical protein [Albugo laibachii Nc14]